MQYQLVLPQIERMHHLTPQRSLTKRQLHPHRVMKLKLVNREAERSFPQQSSWTYRKMYSPPKQKTISYSPDQIFKLSDEQIKYEQKLKADYLYTKVEEDFLFRNHKEYNNSDGMFLDFAKQLVKHVRQQSLPKLKK